MNETDAWNTFLGSGSVLDYLQYKALEKARKLGKTQEYQDEIPDERTDSETTEYR